MPPPLPSVPGYDVWLEEVMRAVMDGSGSPFAALQWWHEIRSNVIEELADSGACVRWNQKICTALLRRAKGHLKNDLFHRELNANPPVTFCVVGRS